MKQNSTDTICDIPTLLIPSILSRSFGLVDNCIRRTIWMFSKRLTDRNWNDVSGHDVKRGCTCVCVFDYSTGSTPPAKHIELITNDLSLKKSSFLYFTLYLSLLVYLSLLYVNVLHAIHTLYIQQHGDNIVISLLTDGEKWFL